MPRRPFCPAAAKSLVPRSRAVKPRSRDAGRSAKDAEESCALLATASRTTVPEVPGFAGPAHGFGAPRIGVGLGFFTMDRRGDGDGVSGFFAGPMTSNEQSSK